MKVEVLKNSNEMKGEVLCIEDLVVRIRNLIFRLARRVPAIKRKIAQVRESTLKSVCEDIAKSVAGHEFTKILPGTGLSKVRLISSLA